MDDTVPSRKVSRKRKGSSKGKCTENIDRSSSCDTVSPTQKVFPGRYCYLCGKKEKNLYTLRLHYTNAHFFTEVAALVKDKTSSQCELCGQQFSDNVNLFNNIVRHRGATHKDVFKFVQEEFENGDVNYDHCKICDVKKDLWKCDTLGQHLIDEHFNTKLEEELSTPGQVECTICDMKYKSTQDMIAHMGMTHGFAMKMYRDFLATKSVTPVKSKRGRKSKHEQSLQRVLLAVPSYLCSEHLHTHTLPAGLGRKPSAFFSPRSE